MQWSTFPNKYVQDVPLSKRKKQSQKVVTEFPDRVPVVVQSCSEDIQLTQIKFLVPKSTSMAVFFAKLREYVTFRRGPLPPEKALFLLVGDRQMLFSMSHSMGDVYSAQGSKDGMLYVWVMQESTFGTNITMNTR